MNNFKKLIVTLSTCALMFSEVAHSSPYISAQIGASHGYASPLSSVFLEQDKFGITGRVATGYLWNLTDRVKLGVEGGAQGYQNIEDKHGALSVTAKRWSLDMLGVADCFITQRFDIFAKLGTALVHQEYTARLNGNDHYYGEKLYFFVNDQPLKSQSIFVPKAEIGAGYNLQKNLNLNLSVNHECRNQQRLVGGTRSYLVGVKYSFS